MERIKYLTMFVLAVVVLAGCGGSNSQGGGLVASSGRSGEVLIVCSGKQWNGELGDSLQAILMQPVSILPQYEPLFLLSYIAPGHFKDSFQKQRNILIFSIDPSLEKGKMLVAYNQWAKPQTVIRISANNAQGLIDELSTRQSRIIDYLMVREMSYFMKTQNRQDLSINREMEQRYKLSLFTPEGFVFAIKDSNFCWLRRDTKDWTQSMMIYTQEYVNAEQFSQSQIIRLRDSLTKKYVFGTADRSYITTDKEHLPPISELSQAFGNNYAVRTVGLWKTEGDFMGGPFVCYTLLDTNRMRVVTLDAFLYAPNDKKRDLLRRMEAILLNANMLDK